MKIKYLLSFTTLLLLAAPASILAQRTPALGLQYIPTQPNLPDIEAIEYYERRRAASEDHLTSEAKRIYQNHIDKILENIPSNAPGAKEIAEKYINKYHEIINYPKNQYGMFQDKAKQFINLVKFDIEKDIIDSYNKYIDGLMDNGYNQLVAGNYHTALKNFNKAIEIVPDYDAAYLYRAITKIKLDDNAEAMKDLNKVLERNPEEVQAIFWRAQAKSNLGDLRGAIIDYNKVIQIQPNYSMAWNNIGFCKIQLKEYTSALNDVNKAIELDNMNADAYDTRGEIKYHLKNYTSAIADFNKSIQLNSQYTNSYYYRGLSKIKLQKKNEGCLDLSKAGELGETKAYDAIKLYCK
jgi:tetratricopeptide (TPR) repeat protein